MNPVQIAGTVIVFLGGIVGSQTLAQGQDSSRFERDLLVLSELLPGRYDNIDQHYFERREGRPAELLHRRIHTIITRVDDSLESPVFRVEDFEEEDFNTAARVRFFSLFLRSDVHGVDMSITENLSHGSPDEADCVVRWTRGAASFRASPVTDNCGVGDLEISGTYFFRPHDSLAASMNNKVEEPYHLARARTFECYLDYPGVSGGVDLPFKRHTGIKLHDKGGSQTITVQDGRVFRLTLRHVDWPINNYEGFFSRDSLVIYLAERIDGNFQSLAYAFTEPKVSRVAINLREVMGRCFQTSGYDQKPFF